MAKNTFLDWDTTANNNTDVGGINIAEGCPPSNINNAIREAMAQLRAGVDGEVVYAAKATNYTALLTDNNAVLRFTAAATLSLTAVATLGANWHITVIADGGDVTIDPNGAETIDGATTFILANGSAVEIISNGSAFFTDKALSKVQPFATLASAATTDLSTVGSQNVTVTGTTTITSFGTAPAGTFRRLVFSGILTLTHNATSLILPGAGNITTEAGDIATFISEGSGNWRCLSYQRAAQVPYTTGTFTPVYRAGGVSTGVTYTTQTGSYTRIGRRIFFSLRVAVSNAGSASGAVTIDGLPFTSSAIEHAVTIGFASGLSGLTSALACFVTASSTSISIRQWGSTGAGTSITQANISLPDIIISGSYEV